MATSSWTNPVSEVLVPHTCREDPDGYDIPIYIRLPLATSRRAPIPITIVLTEPGQCRADYSWALHETLRSGCGCLILETPGTGDSPVDSTDPQSMARLWESVTSWMRKQAVFDMNMVRVWWPKAKDADRYSYLVRPGSTNRQIIDVTSNNATALTLGNKFISLDLGQSSGLGPSGQSFRSSTKGAFGESESTIPQVLHV